MKTGNNLLEYPVMLSGKNTLQLSITDPMTDKYATISTYTLDVPYPWYFPLGLGGYM